MDNKYYVMYLIANELANTSSFLSLKIPKAELFNLFWVSKEASCCFCEYKLS